MKVVFLGLFSLVFSLSAQAYSLDDMSWDEIQSNPRLKVERVNVYFSASGTQKSIFSVCDDHGVLDGGISYVCDEYQGRDGNCTGYRAVENRMPYSGDFYARDVAVWKLVFDTPVEMIGRKQYIVPNCH